MKTEDQSLISSEIAKMFDKAGTMGGLTISANVNGCTIEMVESIVVRVDGIEYHRSLNELATDLAKAGKRR